MEQNAAEKKVYTLNISEVLEHVMPPLQKMELELLEKSVLKDGCRDPLVVWNGTIVDGHNRYRICQKHHIPFNIAEVNFSSQSEAIAWMIKTQIGRRNLSAFQRCEMVLPYEADLKAEAKKRQGKRNDLHESEKSRGRDTRALLADMAGVSHSTLEKVKSILCISDRETLQRVRKGEISIHFAYSSLVSRRSIPTETKSGMPSDRSFVETPDIQTVMKPIVEVLSDLINRVTEGDATTKMIISELEKVVKMIDEETAADRRA